MISAALVVYSEHVSYLTTSIYYQYYALFMKVFQFPKILHFSLLVKPQCITSLLTLTRGGKLPFSFFFFFVGFQYVAICLNLEVYFAVLTGTEKAPKGYDAVYIYTCLCVGGGFP